MECGLKCEIYSRVCGYHRPVSEWNHGKKEEFKQRKNFKVPAGEVVKGDTSFSSPVGTSLKEVSNV